VKRKSRTDKKAYIKKDTQESRQIYMYMHEDKIQTKAEESEAGRQRMTERE